MPELPEVETVVREVHPELVGRRIRSVAASRQRLRQRWLPEWETTLIGRRIIGVRRRGKWIIIDLSRSAHLVIHLGMTGQLTIAPSRKEPEPHTHLRFTLAPGRTEMRFRDVRRFGSAVYLGHTSSLDRFFTEKGLGPEPFALDPVYWRERLRATSRCLKAFLLDQSIVAGVGNIYADESLFRARLHPMRSGHQLTPREAQRLRQAIVAVLQDAIAKRGSSIRDFVGGSGQPGAYQTEFRVYGQAGQPCPRCASPIQRIRLAGRATHFCSRCQPKVDSKQ